MAIEIGDQVMWRGRKAKVLRLRPSLSLSLGGGEIRHGVSEADVEAIPTKPKPSSQKGRAKATRQGDTGGSH